MTYRPLIPTIAPRLPVATEEYNRGATDSLMRILNIYFSQIDNDFAGLLGRQGGQYLNNPYGAFSNDATQSLAAANTAYVVTLNTTDHANGTSLDSNQITVDQSGIYNVQFSLQLENTDTGQAREVWIWLRKNGTDIAGTASTVSVHAAHGGINGYMLGVANFFVELVGEDYIELVVAANSATINIEAYASSASPFTRPSIPSSVVTVSFVSSQSK
jgi:hypothetical protein